MLTLTQRLMQTGDVFDIAMNTWFAQITTAQAGSYPASRLKFCSAVAVLRITLAITFIYMEDYFYTTVLRAMRSLF